MLAGILREQRLQAHIGMYTGIEAPQRIFASADKGNLMLKRLVFTALEGDEMPRGACGAGGLQGQRMPEFQGWNIGLRSQVHAHGDGITFKGLLWLDRHL